MASLYRGKQKFATGCYIMLSPGKGLSFNMSLAIKWYGWPFLFWKAVHKEYSFKWHHYPKVIFNIARLTLRKWRGKDE
jgi:hypothetical protein